MVQKQIPEPKIRQIELLNDFAKSLKKLIERMQLELPKNNVDLENSVLFNSSKDHYGYSWTINAGIVVSQVTWFNSQTFLQNKDLNSVRIPAMLVIRPSAESIESYFNSLQVKNFILPYNIAEFYRKALESGLSGSIVILVISLDDFEIYITTLITEYDESNLYLFLEIFHSINFAWNRKGSLEEIWKNLSIEEKLKHTLLILQDLLSGQFSIEPDREN